jgi:threonine synthase
MNFAVKCLDCGHVAPFFPTSTNCPRCNSQWREAEYEYQALGASFPLQVASRPFDLWRYRELLPIRNSNPSLSLGEGGTPLVQAVNLGMMLGTPNLFIKDERQGPTGSFKDRQAAVTIAALKEAGITEMVAGICHQPGASCQDARDRPLRQPGGQGDRLVRSGKEDRRRVRASAQPVPGPRSTHNHFN